VVSLQVFVAKQVLACRTEKIKRLAAIYRKKRAVASPFLSTQNALLNE
jgi:hypothetical protein